MSNILTVENVIKSYGKGETTVRALDGVSFTVEKGEFVAVMGASGSGKSTLLNVISTIEPLTSGEISIEGDGVSTLKEKDLAVFRRDKLGFVFQEYNLLDSLTIEENITLPLNLKRTLPTATKEALERVANAFGVADQLKKFPYELSGGQRQRVACARAVVHEPALILADEPTGALDSKNSRALMEQLVLMNTNLGSTILMVTHDAAMGAYADRVLFLRDGKIYHELLRKDRGMDEFYRDILAVTATLGGEENVI